MRITQGMYYKNLYGQNNSQLQSKLFDVNKQISSGLKIQYAHDDVLTFTDTMRLDNEISTIAQIKKSTESGYKMSNQTDTLLNEFDTSMTRTRTLLLQASNGSQSNDSMDAIAAELRGIESHFRNLANTSINGQFLFSGSAVTTKPIADDGTYMGNDQSIKSFLGSGVQQEYNLTGADLFLGEESLIKRKITTNVPNYSLTDKYPDFSDTSIDGTDVFITSASTIRDLMGDNDTDTSNSLTNHFYISGSKSSGESFSEHVTMSGTQTVDELLTRIGSAFGNTPSVNLVNVSLSPSGQIVVEDKMTGSSKLEFHMTGAVDYNQADGNDRGDIFDAVYTTSGIIDNLSSGETNFDAIMNKTSANPDLYVKNFVRSGYTTSLTGEIGEILYDKTSFTQNGSVLSSTTSQVLKTDNSFAKDATKLSEVADLSIGNSDTLDGAQFKLTGTHISGTSTFDVQIDLATSGSTFSLDGGTTNYTIFNASSPRTAVDADEMTYRQLMDVVNMVVTNNIPAANTAGEYDTAVSASEVQGNTYLTYDGKIAFGEVNVATTRASISLYDANSGNFNTGVSPTMTFNSNNALTINDPKTDFFKTLNEVITSVEEHKVYPDGTAGIVRNVGMENAISMLDDLQTHLMRNHARVGANSNTLTASLERTSILEISTMTLRSSVIDTDLAEASLTLTQLSLNYEAMLSTVSKISRLSLVNYL